MEFSDTVKKEQENSVQWGEVDILKGVITDYEKGFQEDLTGCLIKELKPQGALEKALIERIAIYCLKLYRIDKAEKEFIQSVLNPHQESTKDILSPGDDFTKTVVENEGYTPKIGTEAVRKLNDVYLKYEISLESRIYKVLSELRQLQTNREKDNYN